MSAQREKGAQHEAFVVAEAYLLSPRRQQRILRFGPLYALDSQEGVYDRRPEGQIRLYAGG